MSMSMGGARMVCPQCSATVADPAPALCPQCHYPLLLAEPDRRHAAEAAALHRPSAPEEDDDATRLVPTVEPAPTMPAAVAPPPPTPTISCPRCGWDNPEERERCERCAATLRPVAAPPPPPPPPPPPGRRGVSWWLVGLAAVVVALLVVAVVLVVPRLSGGSGGDPPASPSDSIAPTTLSAIDAGSIEVTASSVLPEDSEPYGPDRLLDGDPRTAWNSDGNVIGADGHPTLTFTFAQPVRIGRIDLLNGFQKDDRVYGLNCRVKTLQVRAGDLTQTFSLADSKDPQQLTFDSARPVSSVVLTIGDVYPGTKYEDIALSEVTFHGLS